MNRTKNGVSRSPPSLVDAERDVTAAFLCASRHSSGSPELDKGREMEMRWLVVAVSRRGRSKAIKVHSITGMERESLSVPLPIRNSNLPLSSAALHADQKRTRRVMTAG